MKPSKPNVLNETVAYNEVGTKPQIHHVHIISCAVLARLGVTLLLYLLHVKEIIPTHTHTHTHTNLWAMSPRRGASSFCGWMKRPPNMEDGCECADGAVKDSKMGWSSSLEVRRRAYQSSTYQFVTKCYPGPRTWTDSFTAT
jgi:hypothetical protein